jgi:hypothetical protein
MPVLGFDHERTGNMIIEVGSRLSRFLCGKNSTVLAANIEELAASV